MFLSYGHQAQCLCCLSPAHRHPRSWWKHAWASQEQAAEITRGQNKLQVPTFNGQKQLVSLQRAGCPSALCPGSGYPWVLPGPTPAAALETWPRESCPWGESRCSWHAGTRSGHHPDTDPKCQGSPPQSGNRGTGKAVVQKPTSSAHSGWKRRAEAEC